MTDGKKRINSFVMNRITKLVKNQYTRTGIPIAGVSLLFAALFFFSGCKEKVHKTVKRNEPDQVIEGFEITKTSEGKIIWNLAAEKADIFEVKKIVLTEKPIIKFYEEEQLSSTLISDYAKLFTDSSDIETWDNVVIISHKDDSKMETSKAYYKSETNKIYSDEQVWLYQKDSTTTGTGMESTIDLSSVIIKNQKVIIEQTRW